MQFRNFIISVPEEFILTHWNGYDDLSAIQNGVSENLNLFPFTFGIGQALSIYTAEFPMGALGLEPGGDVPRLLS